MKNTAPMSIELYPNPVLTCGNGTPLGAGSPTDVPLPTGPKARKVDIRESEAALWKANNETATIYSMT